mmetsp:Transcript_16311/g.35329  ORF Transcript_16311/g.35329 Transcript_16311/m.35329 type:complete len:211 (-) Transcript_16311:28-660(-)
MNSECSTSSEHTLFLGPLVAVDETTTLLLLPGLNQPILLGSFDGGCSVQIVGRLARHKARVAWNANSVVIFMLLQRDFLSRGSLARGDGLSVAWLETPSHHGVRLLARDVAGVARWRAHGSLAHGDAGHRAGDLTHGVSADAGSRAALVLAVSWLVASIAWDRSFRDAAYLGATGGGPSQEVVVVVYHAALGDSGHLEKVQEMGRRVWRK